ncbi:leucine zipper domain-containing protein [Ornithinimicrobium sufpigmenti]|uniref:leucine zipper domain-containing protein n=1 Tax=Ornithinimicrobium sufpigmenti TaxID=2508882 RepID=UPI00103698C8|nr:MULTISPECIES: leucine zipper domain-containing protein [unclassified Ornithinimicrobium]
MPHADARLTVRGRLLLVQRVREQGWAVLDAAKAMGISRQCAHRWLPGYDQNGVAGLGERSSRPRRCPRAHPGARGGGDPGLPSPAPAWVGLDRRRARPGPAHRVAGAAPRRRAATCPAWTR